MKKSKNFKRILAALMAGAMMMGAAGCSGSGNGSQAESQGSSASENGDSTPEPVEIYWFSDVTGWGPANWNGTDTSPALDYIKENFGITFNIEQPPTDAATKLGMMIATGDLPDMISITNGDTIKELITSGYVWDMESLLKENDPESHLLEDFPEDIKAALTSAYGGWYSYPSHMESADNRENFPPDDQVWVDLVQYGSNSCIMFNTDIMEALDITEEDVSTEEGFYAACEKVKNSGYQVNGESVLPLVLHCNQWIDTSLDGVLSWNFGAVPVDENGDYRHLELSPGYKNALKFVNNCIQKGYLDVNTLTIDETALKTYLDSQRVFCWIGNQAQITKDNTPWYSYGPILADNGAVPTVPISQSAGTGWIQTFVSKDCVSSEAAAKLLSWASSREGLLVNYYGNEGSDYTIDDKGIVTRTEDFAKTYEETYASNMLLWPFANTSFERNTEPVPDPTTNRGVEVQLMPAIGKYEKSYVYDSSVLSFENSSVVDPSSDLGIQLSQIESYLESQKAKIVTAATDEAFETEYNNMISTLEGYNISGVDEAYNEVFQQYCEDAGTTIEDVNADLY